MKTVFVVQHVYENEHEDEQLKFIGVFASRQAASNAVRELARQPGFSEHADGFCIDEYTIGEPHWREGFVSAADSLAAIDDGKPPPSPSKPRVERQRRVRPTRGRASRRAR